MTGLGYRVWVFFNTICFYIGYSHFSIIKNIKKIFIKFRKRALLLFCFDKQILNKLSYCFLNLKKPDKYKIKGIRDIKSKVNLKVGKKR